jgi:hypothetical protein
MESRVPPPGRDLFFSVPFAWRRRRTADGGGNGDSCASAARPPWTSPCCHVCEYKNITVYVVLVN